MQLDDVDETVCADIVSTCREAKPDASGILLHGSYATGRARPGSDLDLVVLAPTVTTVQYRTWFVPRPDGRLLHVSARFGVTLATWAEEGDQPAEWSFGLPVRLVHRWLWVKDSSLVQALGQQPVIHKPAGSPEIEDLIEACLKVRRRARSGDVLGLRLAGQMLARCAARTVAALNPAEAVDEPRMALEALLTLGTAPPHWRADLLTCLGLASAPSTEVLHACNRLADGTVDLVREVNPSVDEQPDLARYISDGTVERYLAQSRWCR